MEAQPSHLGSHSPVDPEESSPHDANVSQERSAGLLGKRRRFLVHRPSQLRAGLFVTAGALLLVVTLNLGLHSARLQATAAVSADSPQLAPLLEAQNRFEMMLGIAASLVFLTGIFVVTILETHKTAGAAYHVSRELERIRDGLYGMRIRLRKGDNLRDIETAFNEMSQALAERANVDVEELEHAASVADRISTPPEAHELASALRDMADERRRLGASLPRRR